MSAHVIYESRLELSRLLMADFDQSVSFIVAQPFLIRGKDRGVVRRHIPDYLLLTDADPVLGGREAARTGQRHQGCRDVRMGAERKSSL